MFSRLKQVIINLVNNAILYTPAKGYIKISLFEYEKTVKIHVKDSGIGIKREEIPRIFLYLSAERLRHYRWE